MVTCPESDRSSLGHEFSHVKALGEAFRALPRTHHAPPVARPFLDEIGAPSGKLRIAFTDRPCLPGEVHADCRAALMETVALCESMGHEVEEASPELDIDHFVRAFFTVICGSVGYNPFLHRVRMPAASNSLTRSARASSRAPAKEKSHG